MMPRLPCRHNLAGDGSIWMKCGRPIQSLMPMTLTFDLENVFNSRRSHLATKYRDSASALAVGVNGRPGGQPETCWRRHKEQISHMPSCANIHRRRQ